MKTIPFSLVMLAIAASVYLLREARELLLPLVLAIFLSLVLVRPVSWLSRCGVPRLLAAFLVTLSFATVFSFGVSQFLEPMERWSTRVPQALDVLQEHGTQLKDRLRRISATKDQVQALANEVTGDLDPPVKVAMDDGGATKQAANYVLDLIYGFFVTMLLLFFLLATGNVLLKRLVQLRQTHEARRRMIRIARAVENQFYRYLLTITLVNIGLALATGTALSIMGIPDAWLWGALAGTLNYAPYVGTVISAGAITLAAVVSQDTLLAMMIPGTIYLIANGLEAGILTPALLGERLSLNPMFVLMSIVLFGWLWGPAGMFVAVPTLVISKVVMSEFGGPMRPWARVLAS